MPFRQLKSFFKILIGVQYKYHIERAARVAVRCSVSKKSERYGVIPNQSADWCGNPPVERKSYWFRIENI